MSHPIWSRGATLEKRSKHSQNTDKASNAAVVDRYKHTIATKHPPLSELQALMNDKFKLDVENSSLKRQIAELRKENENIAKFAESEKVRFDDEINQLRLDIKNNEAILIENNRKCIQQQKQHIQEIKQLKSDNEQLKQEKTKKEKQLTEEITKLKKELKSMQLNCKTLNAQNNENAEKSSKYKNKLRFAIKIINQLNNVLIECTARPKTCQVETQTESGRSTILLETGDFDTSNKRLSITHSKRTMETENLLLSDIFFKSHSLSDNELVIFNEKKVRNSQESCQL